jgi:hypothetical protein
MDAQAQALIREVWEVVDINYLDARRCVVSVHAWREQSCMVNHALSV